MTQLTDLRAIMERWIPPGFDHETLEQRLMRGILHADAIVEDMKRVIHGGEPVGPMEELGLRPKSVRLIKVAPELLASLEEMVAGLLATAALGLNEEEVGRLKRAEAIIARAKCE